MNPFGGIDIDGLRGFVAIAKHASYQTATLELNTSASALTRRIQKLERGIGAPLFERTTRRVQLTPVGERFLPRAEAILRDLKDALAEIDDQIHNRQGQLSVACIPTAIKHMLPRIIQAFHARRPQTGIRVVEGSVATVVKAVQEGTVEFGITLLTEADSRFAFDPLLTEPFFLVCPAGHALAGQASVRWNDLKPYRLIVSEPGSGNRAVLEQALRKWRWQRDRLVEIDHLTSSLGLVEAGLGISVVPLSALPAKPEPALVIRELKEPSVTRTMGLLRRRGLPLDAAAQQFRRAVRQLAAPLADEAAEKAARLLS